MRRTMWVLTILAVDTLWNVGLMCFESGYLPRLGPIHPATYGESISWMNNIPAIFQLVILFTMATVEEFLFRGIPLLKYRSLNTSKSSWIKTSILSSIIFGLGHGGVAQILYQGVDGFLWCILFMVSMGPKKEPIPALISCIWAHFLFNVTLYYVLT